MRARSCLAAVLLATAAAAGAQPASRPATAASGASVPPRLGWLTVPRSPGRLGAQDIGLVINTSDPYSVEVGEFYAQARKLSADQVLRVQVPVKPRLDPEEFDALKARIEHHFGPDTQALALAWTQPYAVQCNSITGALALGYDAQLCAHPCAPSKRSPYFNARSARPYTDLQLRPAMLLAAHDAAGAKSLIERGVQSDHTLGLRGAPPVHAYFVATRDRARNARAPLFPPAGTVRGAGIVVHVETSAVHDADGVLLVETGAAHVEQLDTLRFVPGALADHLTSFGGQLDGQGGQMSALEWIAAGATASYGTVSEPCSHPQKFPHPQLLLLHYAQGSTAIEAYWKSVAWPLQGVFIGEPLAAPFPKR
ncbi:MAG TPA: TIGR03790 family protein [Albitalea sp.]|uniref:TIGR03790 family protein n=1 Tax=Piscinibacter sp. TaxID=1903157 RepID=UPI002ED33B16